MVELYIDGHKADLTTNISVSMNYELEKLENPTIVKNSFSKTISLQATPNNNKIFGFYYELDKVHNGTGFNAIKRIPFELYRDSDLIETGYLQLNNIKYKGNTYTYEITLYGGLGDFFYSLAYDEEGNEKTLADLNYGYGENDEGFEFRMNADSVIEAWDNIEETELETPLGETINFIPSYNGLYEDFDNDKVLINTKGQNIFPKSFSGDNKTYSTINGYAIAELEEEMTEWQIRDLRCYKQRPALRLKKFIEAICKPENNGGYEVELDKRLFFNEDNKYYQDAWIALPLMNQDSEEWPKTSQTITTNPINDLNCPKGGYYGVENAISNITFTTESQSILNTAGGNSTININCDFSLKITADSEYEKLWLSAYDHIKSNQTVKPIKPVFSCFGVWLEAYVDNKLIGISNCAILGKSIQNMYLSIGEYVTTNSYVPNTSFIYYNGDLIRRGDKTYIYEGCLRSGDVDMNTTLSNTFRLTLNNVPNFQNLQLKLKCNRWWNENGYNITDNKEDIYSIHPVTPTNISFSNIITPDCTVNLNSNEKTLQDVILTKGKLLKNKVTPASLLLSYTKLFGLYFFKDILKKKISIMTRNTYFKNAEIIDIDNKIDYSNEVKIEPLMFNKKWYTLKCPALETTKMKKFQSNYLGSEYGQKRINTNYNFNTDEEDIYSDNQYQNVITMLDSSKYYKNFYNKGTREDEYVVAPTFGIYGCKYKLWYNANVEDAGEKDLGTYDILSKEKAPVQFGTLVGQDVFPKICCFNEDNNKQSLNDLNVSLVFYNEEVYTSDSELRPVYYTISNDLPMMYSLNDGTPLYLWSTSEKDEDGNKICHRRYVLPQFTRYDIEFGNIANSFDFGVPYETYITANYPEDATLYNKFWQRFYQDHFNENTRKVTAYVKFDDVMLGNHSLSNFYYFNNCYWLLNKIVDYDIANPAKKVKCEFIKVNNTNNYTNGQILVKPFYVIDTQLENLEDYTIIENDLTFGGTYKVRFKTKYGIQYLELTMKNTTKEEREKKLSVVNEGNGYYTVTVSDIVGNTYIFIAGYYEKTISINYGLKAGVTIPASVSSKELQITGGDKNTIVWENVIDDSDTMDITIPKYSNLYYRLIPNAYGSANRLRFGLSITKYYTDGTTESFTSSISTDSWSSLNINTNKVLQSIQLSVYDATVL